MRIRTGRARGLGSLRVLLLAFSVHVFVISGDAQAQSNSFANGSFVAVHPGVAPVAVAPPLGHLDGRNSAGWNTGYSAVTSSYERPSRLGGIYGVGDTVPWREGRSGAVACRVRRAYWRFNHRTAGFIRIPMGGLAAARGRVGL